MTNILLCTRGRGRAHATIDLALSRELQRLQPDLTIAFASYSIGYGVLQQAGVNVHNLYLDECNPLPATTLRIVSLIRSLRPQLIVAHEELGALLAAAICRIRAVYTTYWFPRVKRSNFQALDYASRVLFMENAGLFEEPETVRGRVTYCGPVLRRLVNDPAASSTFRQRLGLRSTDTLVTVLPGSPSEAREPILDLVVEGYKRMTYKPDCLMWIAGRDVRLVSERLRVLENVVVLESTPQIDIIIQASDVIITKGTYNTTREIAAFGHRSISLSHERNWVDDYFASLAPRNISLAAGRTSAEHLASQMDALVTTGRSYIPDERLSSGAGLESLTNEVISEWKVAQASPGVTQDT